MADETPVTVAGNATKDPELRFTPSGQAVATFSVAVNKRKKGEGGRWEDAGTAFFDVVCWAQMAENVAESVRKGARVLVKGRLDQRTWETQEGDKRSKVEIVADDVAVSLKWATATVTRNERREGSSSKPAPREDPAPSYDPDEEPF